MAGRAQANTTSRAGHRRGGDPRTDVAIVMVRGEHDLSKPELAEALARASDQPDVLVELPECTFRDSSVIAALVEASPSLWERDSRLELVITPEAHAFQRVAKFAGIHMFFPIDETRSAGIVSIQGEE
jgi:anti-anti-sigma regulatory factor